MFTSPGFAQHSDMSWEKLSQALFERVLLSLSGWYTAVMSIFSLAPHCRHTEIVKVCYQDEFWKNCPIFMFDIIINFT